MIIRLTILLLFLHTASISFCQTYPVQASTTLIPPYSVYLADYVTPGSQRLALNIYLADINRPELNVRIKLHIEGQGIRIETKSEYLPPPLIIRGGVPERLTATDLAPLFRPENLNFQGITRRQFEQKGALPEGLYQFCFEILEYNRGVKISNSACAMAWLILNDPPIINMPRNGEKVKAQNPQYITFQWTPRHTGSPNSAFSTEYEFSLVEIWPENRNPNDAILTSPPIYESTTFSTTLIYGPAEPALIPGRHYAFRVRAKSMVGIDELNLFKNNGYSPVYTFIYGDPCNVPQNISASALSSTRFKVEWKPLFNHTDFIIRYREANDDGQWLEEDTFLDEIEVNSLEPGTTYEYQVLAGCASLIGDYSEIAKVTTKERPKGVFACGAAAPDFDLENEELIQSLKPGDYIYSGDFEIKLDSVSPGKKGTFTGGGKVVIPFLNFVKVRTVFRDIEVNTDYRVIKGNVYTYWDPNSKLMYDDPKRDSIREAEKGSESIEDSHEVIADTNAPLDSLDEGETVAINSDSTGASLVTASADTVLVDQEEDVLLATSDEGASSASKDGTNVEINQGGGGKGTGSLNGNNGSRTASNGEANLIFGPLSIKFSEPPKSVGTDENGYCKFEDVKASFLLTLVGQNEISKEINVENAVISFKKHCENNEYKDVAISWTHPTGIDLGKIKFIDVSLKHAKLQIDSEGNLTGSLGLHASLNEDQRIGDVIRIRKGLNGDFAFHYNGEQNFNGYFSFEGINGVSIDLLKGEQVLGSLKNGVFDQYGKLTGDLNVQPGAVKYESNNLKVAVEKFNANITYSLFNGLKFNTGNGQFTISEIKGLDGTLTVALGIQEEIFNTRVINSTFSGYGLTFSNLNIRALVTKDLEFNEINGSLSIKHNGIDNQINIQEFEIKNGKLTRLRGSGRVNYQELDLNITNTKYDPETDLIVIDAHVELKKGDLKIAAGVDDFTIDRAGNITFGGYNVNVSGQMYFGPLKVALTGNVDSKGEKVDGKYRKYTADAAFYLKMKGARGVEKEVAIAKGKLTYVKHKKKDLFRKASLFIDDAKISVGELYGINASISSLGINIYSDSEFSAYADMQNNVFIKDDSYVSLDVLLTDDKSINNLIKLRKGLTGQVKFNFAKGNDFKGSFDFSGVKNLNLVVEKTGKAIATLRNGSFDKSGNFNGTLMGLQGTTYKSGGFDLTVDQLELGVALNLHEGWNSLKIQSGKGKFSVRNITGVQGVFRLGMAYGVDGNFNAQLLTKESKAAAFGMNLSEMRLQADFTEGLELKTIAGSVKAAHPQFDAALNVSKFEIVSGELKVWKANGSVRYKDFNFELTKSSFINQKLSITAKVEIDNAGKLAVDKFIIDKDGAISIGKIAGNLNKPMVEMAFNAAFKESGFKGSFKGNIKFLALEGAIDFGTQDNFSYGYLRMAAEARRGVPLGPTGLQLTKVGGQLGYNYHLKFSAGKFTGSPKQHNYLVGLTLGISDVTNMFAAEGTTVVQFGNDKLQLSLSGNIKAPRSNPIIESGFNVNYYLSDNIIDGSLNVDINVPASSGLVFQTTSPASLNFSYANEDWHVEGGVRAAMFRQITFIGNTSLSKSESSISGLIRGRASYAYRKSFNYDFYVADVQGEINLGFSSNVDASIGANGIEGSLGVHVYGNGELMVSTILGSVYGAASVDCRGEVSYKNNQGLLRGEASISIQSSLSNFEESVSIEKYL